MTKALVTGATSGIGRAIALGLKAAGHEVIAVGRQADALHELAALGLQPVQLDLAVPGAAAMLAGFALDVLVNNAGTMLRLIPFCDMTEAEIDGAVMVNLRAVLAVTRAVAPGMRDRG